MLYCGRAIKFEKMRGTVDMSELRIPDMILRSWRRFWNNLSLWFGAVDKFAVVSFGVFTD